MRRLTSKLKLKAEAAFSDNSRLTEMTEAEREEAAQFYEAVAMIAKGTRSSIASMYNLERARFLRGEVKRIAHSAPAFAREIQNG